MGTLEMFIIIGITAALMFVVGFMFGTHVGVQEIARNGDSLRVDGKLYVMQVIADE